MAIDPMPRRIRALAEVQAGPDNEGIRDGYVAGRLRELANELDPDPWGLVIDQVVGLAAVYDIDPGSPTTPDEVHDLWAKVVVAIAEAQTEATAAASVEHSTRLQDEVLGLAQRVDDALAERDAYRAASDQWHLLTEALPVDLRIIPGDAPNDAETWLKRIRDALWMAYGIGRRHGLRGLSFADRKTPTTPFAATDLIERS